MEWPDFMMPIAPNYTMIEAAIMECAWAGCETIWVCLYEDTAPLVRHRIGDFVQDPVWAWRNLDPQPTARQKEFQSSMFRCILRIDSEEIAWHGQLLKELFQPLKFQPQCQDGFIQTSIGYLFHMGISILSY